MAGHRMILAMVTMAIIASVFTPTVSAINDVDILQFALNLEYLEANFYSCATYGKPIDANLMGGGPAPTGCKQAKLSPDALAYARNIAKDEIAHVAFLRAALTAAGVTPVPQPAIDVGSAFAAAANAAVGGTLSPSFDPYGSDLVFYHGAYIFEDVGVTAYKGAAPLIANKAYLGAAAGILSAEAYHAGAIRTLLFKSIDTVVFPYGDDTATIIKAISALRDAAGGTNIDKGVGSYGNLLLVPADANGVTYSRTPAEVLKIVYLGGTTKGGFFPNGLNGVITSAA